ncbi:hypothetical protein [Massilia niastensis]|uniref:hypothetical protein n=1 Tax=Massilia niastensis TaxID=544911 RepID=UPI0004759EFB|nr:hypothetical protein [Massilia niastensis]
MRLPLLLLAPMLLAGCTSDSTSYLIDGSNQHALIVRVDQEYFWSKRAVLRLIVSNMPDCQRQMELGQVRLPGLEIELFDNGNGVYTLRADDEAWQVETQGCNELEAPDADSVTGQALGIFRLDGNDGLVFEKPEA